MQTNSCQIVFNEAYQDRQNYPLHAGLYKLRETYKNFKGELKTISNINDHIKLGLEFHPNVILGSCTSCDHAQWMQDLPHVFARQFGYNLLPSAEALQNEGVRPDDLENITTRTRDFINRTIQQCDYVRDQLQYYGIKSEYQRMEQEQSLVLSLAIEIEDFTRDLLEEADGAAKRHFREVHAQMIDNEQWLI